MAANSLVLTLDFIGTFAFAISGATAAVRKHLDLFGVLVVAFAAATAGGVARDVLLGAHPPVAVVDPRYLLVCLVAGLVTFYRHEAIECLRNPVQFFDAVGLALFAVIGSSKAIAYGVGPVGAALLGMLTGIGGGMMRDLLVMQVPQVLQRELYAVAALLGAAMVVGGHALGLPPAVGAVTGAVACFALRLLAMWRGWQLPVARPRDSH